MAGDVALHWQGTLEVTTTTARTFQNRRNQLSTSNHPRVVSIAKILADLIPRTGSLVASLLCTGQSAPNFDSGVLPTILTHVPGWTCAMLWRDNGNFDPPKAAFQ